MKKSSVFVYLFAALCMSLSALPNASDYEIYDHNQVLEVQYDWLGIKVFDEPGSSNTVHVLNHKEAGESYKSSAITSDYKWVKILFNGFSGWVPADALSVDRGGPVIETPESIVRFELIDGNLI